MKCLGGQDLAAVGEHAVVGRERLDGLLIVVGITDRDDSFKVARGGAQQSGAHGVHIGEDLILSQRRIGGRLRQRIEIDRDEVHARLVVGDRGDELGVEQAQSVGGQALADEFGDRLVGHAGVAQGGRGGAGGDELKAQADQGVRELDDAGAVGDMKKSHAGRAIFASAHGSISSNSASVKVFTPRDAAFLSLEPASSP